MPTTRAEHLEWCKQRALEYTYQGGAASLADAFASMVSDLGKHPETSGHIAIQLGMSLLICGHLSTPNKMRDFINGFN